jgi:carbonic anhydrase/acetyltransferase-like protein (isoleucine patch superfamily)
MLVTIDGVTPTVDSTAFVAPTASVIGRVSLAANSSVFYGAVLRGDIDSISIGAGSNVQDNVSMHTDVGINLVVGSGVSIGHNAVVHGCTVEDDCLIGMGAIILNHAVIGTGSLVAAGAVVLEGTVIPPGSLVAGVPAKVRRELTAEEREHVKANAAHYVGLAAKHRDLPA